MSGATEKNNKKKIVVYTCIVNNYDSLRPIPDILYAKMKDSVDFICLTDNVDLYSANPGNWNIIEMPVQLANLLATNPVKAQRMVKILPMKFLPDRYDISMWIDSNIEIRSNLLTDFFPKYDLNECPIYTNRHPQRRCIYDEELTVIRLKKDSPEVCKSQIAQYMGEKYPVNNGLAETNVILRSNNDPGLVKMSYLWAEQILKWSKRDQLSFDYCCWKTGLKYGHLKEDYVSGKVMRRVPHGRPKEILKIEELEKKVNERREEENRRQKLIEVLEKSAKENKEVEEKRRLEFEELERKTREQEKLLLSYKNPKQPTIRRNKNVIYTCIVNGYDSLKPLPKVPEGFDLICFTDNLNIPTFNQWKLRKIPEELRYLSYTKANRLVKFLPHRFLSEYEISLWIDGNMEIQTDLTEFFKKYNFSQFSLWTSKHPERNCIYQEAVACVEKGKESSENVERLVKQLHSEGYPENNGLAEMGVILRKHHDPECVKLMEMWASKFLGQINRDQLLFNYCCWKLGFKYGTFDRTIMRGTRYPLFKMKSHQGRSIYNTPFTIATINFNTTNLTNVWLKSILKHCHQDNIKIIIFDNSDKEKFVPAIHDNRLTVLDNTEGKIIDYEKELEEHGAKTSYISWANLKHSIAVQWLLDNLNDDNMVLFDSDTVLKVPLYSDFIDDAYVTKADLQHENPGFWHKQTGRKIIRYARFLPFIQYFNIKKIRELNLRYLDDSRIISGKNDPTFSWDTGAAFYADVIRRGLPYKIIQMSRYINHLMGASWAKVKSEEDFIENNRIYWE